MDNQSPPLNNETSAAPQTQLYNPGLTQPVANEVAKKLVSGESPLDFIKKNIAARAGMEIVPDASLKAEEAKRSADEAKLAVEEMKQVVAAAAVVPVKETLPVAAPVVEAAPKELSIDVTPEEPDTSSATNFKNIRKVLHETKNVLSTKEQELQQTREELEKYKTGEILSDALQEKETEIARLSKYEKIVSLKTAPEYQEKFIKPLTNIKEQLVAIANDYKIPPNQLLSAVNVRNQADLNRFLSNHLDDGGFLEVKQLIKQAQGLQDQAQAAEKEPVSTLQTLIEEGQQVRATQVAKNREAIRTTVKSSWDEAYEEIKQEGKAIELIYKEDDPEFNKTYVEPLIKQAAQEYGKAITMLAENGLEKMSKEFGKAFAKTFLLAQASATAIPTRSEAVRQSEELLQNQARNARIYRPQVGSSAPGVETSSQAARPMTPLEAGKSLINNVLASKRK
jgi:hypothetical protein